MADLTIGDVLENRYRIEAPIARGGMSTVYRCVDTRLGRLVAAKVMDQRYLDDPIFKDRFRREARSMAQLSHPCLVGVYDFSSDGDNIFLIMELIIGGTLRELLAERGPMPPHAAVAVMRSVLTGLSVAHSAGMVHRDIKPDNVLINADHQVKLADFGLVRAASASQATSNQIVGTVSYLSPEQVSGDDIGPESDVYSAGIVMFELLTGTTPFSGDNQIAHAYARLDSAVPAPSSMITGIPPLVDALVASATALRPEERFADAAEFLNALDDVAQELRLPDFRVPVPANAAAYRSNEHLTGHFTTSDLMTTDLPRETEGLFPIEDASPHTRAFQPITPQPAAPIGPVAQRKPDYSPEPVAPQHAPAATHEPVTNRSKISFVLWLIAVITLATAVALGAWWFGSGRYGEVPQVLGLDQVQAVAVTEESGFGAVTEPVYSDDVPKNAIAGTKPDQGQRAVKGDDITLLVSQGRPTVPDVPQSRSASEYRRLLEERTLEYRESSPEFSDSVPEGKIAHVVPGSGNEVAVGSAVSVTLSQGPAPVNIPNVSERPVDQARSELEKLGFDVTIAEEFSDTIPGGDAIGTDPAAGTTLPRGSSVTLKVSTSVEIPDVRGKSRHDAISALADAGITVESISRSDNEVGNSADEVTSITPSSGSLIDPAHTKVSLVLAGRVEVPSVVGKRYAEAKRELEAAGFSVTTSGTSKSSARVYWQTPAGGRAEPGATIKLKTLSS